ncbi:MAG: beta-glucuronidase [Oscillospiraceae bacterium]|nr:beta-glucuronidase [Oscillospiraceae bacterium]
MLYPIESESREVKDLSGLWNFKVDKEDEGLYNKWYMDRLKESIVMPVPASYNDITTDASIRDHIGNVWYERTFFVPDSWRDKLLMIRVGSAAHHAILWINSIEAVRHRGGFLPFEADISDMVKYGEENRVTVCVNNVLDWTCLPTGEIKTYNDEKHPAGYKVQETYFDFYNYSGIHRPVKLYTTPKTYIEDIKVTTDICGVDGVVKYDVVVKGENISVLLCLSDETGSIVAEGTGSSGSLMVSNAKLWQPGKPYLYTLSVKLTDTSGKVVDVYRLPFGIRTVKVEGSKFFINGVPFYFKGFGKHEDSDIRGKGLDEVLNVRDFNLLKWIGANSFRTSHYPYSEEIINLADQEGIVLIDEAPAVGMCLWNDDEKIFAEDRINANTLDHHLQTIREMIARDKNHPSVVMWSVANEAATNEEAALPYFTSVVNELRKLDPSRPVTIVHTVDAARDKVSQLFDVICINRYFGWYIDHGVTDFIEKQMDSELLAWHKKYPKPIIVTEFGADTVAGFHQIPPVAFTEDFQCEFLEQYFKSFDKFDFVIGEHIWAFADFATKQGLTRVIGNKKGVFTRQRQPKAAAYLLKARWTKI